MTTPKGIDWTNVTFVTGTRHDLAPTPFSQEVYTRPCGKCEAKTLTEVEYPLDVPLLCNVCAAQITASAEADADTLLLYDFPADLKARLIDFAREKRLPVEEVFKDFLAWKLGRPTKAILSTTSEKKKAK
jgi:hypothetical protein